MRPFWRNLVIVTLPAVGLSTMALGRPWSNVPQVSEASVTPMTPGGPNLHDIAGRLRSRMVTLDIGRTTPMLAARRNPMQLVPRAPVTRALQERSRQEQIGLAPASIEPPPVVRLIGISGQRTSDHTTFTGIFDVNGELHFASLGDRVIGRFVVVHIDEDTVEVRDVEKVNGNQDLPGPRFSLYASLHQQRTAARSR